MLDCLSDRLAADTTSEVRGAERFRASHREGTVVNEDRGMARGRDWTVIDEAIVVVVD